MILYTCKGAYGQIPVVHMHGCANALNAMDACGVEYEHQTVDGLRVLPWTMGKNRDLIRELSGQKLVPILVLDDDTVLQGSTQIIAWAKQHPETSATV
jgi:glutathione S-transferase